jgi:hypothetical protein
MAITIPTDITGCKLWLSADRNVSISSGAVANIYDNSTQGCDGAASTRPTYATAPYKAMRFDASNAGTASTIRVNLSNGATLTKGACSVAFICKVASACEGDPGVANQALIGAAGDGFAINVGFNFSTTIYNGSSTVRSQLRFPASISLIVVTTTATSATVYVNGQSETIDASFSSTWAPAYIGNSDASSSPFVGHIYEAMAWDTAISATNVADLLTYMQGKYGKETEAKRIVCKGSSTTRGNASSGLCTHYVHKLEPDYPDATIFGFGVGGITQSTIDSSAALDVDAAFRPSVDNVLVLQSGSNDIYVSSSTAAALLAQIKSYGLQRKALGYKVVIQTVLPRGTAGSAANTVREAYNELVRSESLGTFWDAVADVAAIPELADGAQASTTFYNADTVHLNDAGHSLITPVIKAAIDAAFEFSDTDDDDTDLTTVDNVLAQTGLSAFSDADTVFVSSLIDEVSVAIARHCNRITQDNVPTFLSASRTEYYDGTFADEIVLRAYPVTTIASVYTIDNSGNETLVDSDSYRYDPTTGVLKLLGGWDIEGEFIESAVLANRPGYYVGPYPRWPRGMRNVKVTYTGGWTALPNDLVRIATQMVYDLYVNRRENRRLALDVAGSRSVAKRGVGDMISMKADDLAPFVRRGLF